MEPQKSPTLPERAASTDTHPSSAAKEQRGTRFCKAEATREVNEAAQSRDRGLEVAQGPSPDQSA